MRIYEFSQLKNISSKDVLEKLRENGLEAKSHMSILDSKTLEFLESVFSEKKEQSNIPSNNNVTDLQSSKPIEQTVQEPLSNSPKNVVDEKAIKVDATKASQALSPMTLIVHQMSVGEFSEKTKKPIADVIINLLKWGIVATRNQTISDVIVKRLAEHYGITCTQPMAKAASPSLAVGKKTSPSAHLKERPPVVVVVGHVDHGKTTLLDYIRKTRVALKEKGGITQHLGAYEAVTAYGNIVFLDTPGHEAFGKIRQRGIKVADLVVLVVAADDGVMPQTIEAIKYAQSLQVPMVVVLNKIDRVDSARIEVVKRQLNQYGVTVEDWGGDIVCVPISAKFGTGVDQLLEMLSLQAQIMELRAEIDVPASGYILESSLEKGRGVVATVITQAGILRLGDYFVCGTTSGHITSLINSHGQRVKEASTSIPIQVAGFNERPEAGDFFEIIPKDRYLKVKSSAADNKPLINKHFVYKNGINILVKADNHSSLEAVVDGIDKLSKKSAKGFNIMRYAVGNVGEGDIEFAYNTAARIVCFNVKAESNAQELADAKKVTISYYGIIYKLLEDLDALAESQKEVEIVRTKIGEATILKVFDIKKIGVIAGALLRDGRFTRDGLVVVWRGKTKVGEGKISSLQRDKKSVKEVFAGFEFAFMVHNFSDWLVDDRVECFIDIPKK